MITTWWTLLIRLLACVRCREEAKQRAARQLAVPRAIALPTGASGSHAGHSAATAAAQAALAKRQRVVTGNPQQMQHARPLGQPPAFLAVSFFIPSCVMHASLCICQARAKDFLQWSSAKLCFVRAGFR